MTDNYRDDNQIRNQENQSEYLKIIDDLSSELNTLSCQVDMVQQDFLADEIAKQFEDSLKDLETQNDLLQAAVERLIEEKETIRQTLQTQNEDLKSRLCNQEDDIKALHIRICQLEKRSCGKCSSLSQIDEQPRRPSREESGGDIRQFEIDLKRKSKIVECLKSENASLNDELSDLRRQRAKAKLLERRPMVMSRSSLASSLQHTDAEVASKLSLTQEKLREQSKELQKANREVQSLQEELGHLRRSEEILTKERDLLKTELCALKESQASAAGTQQSLQEQLLGTIDELYLVKEQLREVTEAKDNIESGLRAEINTIQERRADLLDNYNKLVEEFNKINKEYQKVVQIEQEKTRLILTFNTWKKEQLKIEKDMRRKVEIFEDHIRELLADKERLLTQLEETENDNRTLLLSIDNSSAYGRRQSTSPSRGYQVFAQSSSTDPVSKVIENVRTATRKMSKQRTLMDDESRYLSN